MDLRRRRPMRRQRNGIRQAFLLEQTADAVVESPASLRNQYAVGIVETEQRADQGHSVSVAAPSERAFGADDADFGTDPGIDRRRRDRPERRPADIVVFQTEWREERTGARRPAPVAGGRRCVADKSLGEIERG